MIRYFLLWLPMIVLAFANATLRELVFVKHFKELRAHQLSTLTLILLCAVYTGALFSLLHIKNTSQALLAGAIWVVLTVLFEFSLGRFVNRTWASLLQDYNIAAGRIWLLFLICLFLMPWLFYGFKK